MCGICGIVSRESLEAKTHKIKAMTTALYHRGPDDVGHYINDKIALGHTRLSIIDIHSGPQPISNETNTIQAVFNGEIFNFRELRKELLSQGHKFKTQTDSEVIVHAYEEYGNECYKHFRGQFAIGIWDSTVNRLILVRDRIGIKPLYYIKIDDQLIFASEIKSILPMLSKMPSLNTMALNRYLTQGYCWGEDTMFNGVKKLLPGHIMIYENSQMKFHQYWHLSDFQNKSILPSFTETKERVYAELKNAVEMRLISDVPLGAFLSGGVDSSILVALMSELQPQKLNTFSVGFKDSDFDESSFARKVATQYQTLHHELLGEESATEIFEKVIWHLDEPISDQATIPTFLLSSLTKKHVTVALSGDGSDEILGGYNKFLALYYEDKYLKYLPKQLQAPFLNYLKTRIPYRENFHGRHTQMVDRYFSLQSAFTLEERTDLFLKNNHIYETEDEIKKAIPPGLTPLQQVQYIDINYWLVNDILLKTDKMAMASGLEVRVPYLDHKFMELTMNIEDSHKINMGIGKYVLKRAFGDKLPLSVLYRKKQGFNYPLESVFSEKKISECFLDSPLFEILDSKKVMRIVANRNTSAYLRRQFRNLFFLFSWHKVFMEKGYANFSPLNLH